MALASLAPSVAGPRAALRWGIRHGLPGVYLSRAARRGDLVGRLLRDPGQRIDPHPLYEGLRARGPLVPSTLGLVTTSYAVATEVLRSADFGVGWDRSAAPRWLQWALRVTDEPDTSGVAEPPSMLVVDPPDHTRFRRLVSRAFTPRATAAFEPLVQATADRLLDRLAHRAGPVDLVAGYAAELPVRVISQLLGVPVDRREDFLRWGGAAAATLDPGLPFLRYAAAERALREMHGFLRDHFERLRRQPGEDLVSQLVGLPGEEALTERELHAMVMLLLGAGFETTVNLLGNAVVLLDAHREQWAALVAGPGLGALRAPLPHQGLTMPRCRPLPRLPQGNRPTDTSAQMSPAIVRLVDQRVGQPGRGRHAAASQGRSRSVRPKCP